MFLCMMVLYFTQTLRKETKGTLCFLRCFDTDGCGFSTINRIPSSLCGNFASLHCHSMCAVVVLLTMMMTTNREDLKDRIAAKALTRHRYLFFGAVAEAEQRPSLHGKCSDRQDYMCLTMMKPGRRHSEQAIVRLLEESISHFDLVDQSLPARNLYRA